MFEPELKHKIASLVSVKRLADFGALEGIHSAEAQEVSSSVMQALPLTLERFSIDSVKTGYMLNGLVKNIRFFQDVASIFSKVPLWLSYAGSSLGTVSSAGLEPAASSPEGAIISLVEKGKNNNRISLSDIRDENLRAFLEFLKENSLTKILVYGGAVRDVFFGRRISDIDITVKIEFNGEEENHYRQAEKELLSLANLMGVKIEDFVKFRVFPGDSRFRGLEVQYVGPIQLRTAKRDIYLNRVIIDGTLPGRIISNLGASLLQMAIDCEGNLYGRTEALSDLLSGRIRIAGDGYLTLGSMLRMLRLKHQFNLDISAGDYRFIETASRQYVRQYVMVGYALRLFRSVNKRDRDPLPVVSWLMDKVVGQYLRGRWLIPEPLAVIYKQIYKVIENAINHDMARKELEALGVFRSVGRLLSICADFVNLYQEIEELNRLDENLPDKISVSPPHSRLPMDDLGEISKSGPAASPLEKKIKTVIIFGNKIDSLGALVGMSFKETQEVSSSGLYAAVVETGHFFSDIPENGYALNSMAKHILRLNSSAGISNKDPPRLSYAASPVIKRVALAVVFSIGMLGGVFRSHLAQKEL